MPNLKNVLQIVVEIDGGGEATRTQTVLHQNQLPMSKLFLLSNENFLQCHFLWIILFLSIWCICLGNTGNICKQQCPITDALSESVIYIFKNLPRQILFSILEFLSFHDLKNLMCYDFTNIVSSTDIFTKFEKRTYGSMITEYVPHVDGTYLFPNFIKQIAEFTTILVVESLQTPANMVLYHDGRLNLEVFSLENIKPLFFEAVESFFFSQSCGLKHSGKTEVTLYLFYFDQTMQSVVATITSSSSTWKLALDVDLHRRHELVSISPSIVVFRMFNKIYVKLHSFDSKTTWTTRWCQYYQLQNQNMPIDQFFNHISICTGDDLLTILNFL